METPPTDNAPTAKPAPPHGKAKLPAPATLAEFVAASGGNTARVLLRELGKGAVSIPSSDDSLSMVRMLLPRSDGSHRIIFLLQALNEATGSLREAILGLAEDYLRERGAFPSSPLPLSTEQCRLAIDRLLCPVTPQGPKPMLDIFCLFLLFAFHRGWLTDDDALALLERAFPSVKSKRSRSGDAQPPEPSPIAIILGTPLKKPNLPPLLELNSAWKKRTASAVEQIHQLEATIAQLESEKAQVGTSLQQAREEISGLKGDVRQKAQRIRDLETELTDVRTAERHRYDSLKGRLRGFLEGELLRWLQNAAEAADAERPYLSVVQQRLRSALTGIQKESQWLQSSD